MNEESAGPSLPSLPMTAKSPLQTSFQYEVVIGSGSSRKVYRPKSPPPNSYWFLAIDRYTLEAPYNQVQTSNDQAPQGISPYDTNDYMLVVGTYALSTIHLPQGPLFDFLVDNGAGRQLQRLEQISSALSCGELGHMAYVLVGVLGEGPSPVPGIEASSILQSEAAGTILTVTLIATKIGDKVIYTPTMQ